MTKSSFNTHLNKQTAHILVAEDDEFTRLAIVQFLEKSGYHISVAKNGLQAVELAKETTPDIILMDSNMPELDGIEATKCIRQQTELEHTPILMITSYSDETHVNRAFDAGATEYIAKPIHWAILGKRLNYLWESTQKHEMAKLAILILENTSEAMIVTDTNLKILALNSAFTTITGYSEKEALGNTPRIMQSGQHDKVFYRQIWKDIRRYGKWEGEIWNKRKNGEIYPENLSINEVRNRSGRITHYVGSFSDITEIKAKEQHLQTLAHVDNLTGLASRWYFEERFNQVLSQASLNQQKLAFLYIDLDNFKPVNDKHGHDVGDEVLKISAQRLSQSVRRHEDIVSRLGGDEFGVVLQDIKQANEVAHVAEKLIQNIAKRIAVTDVKITLSCSVGIAIYPDHGEDPDTLMKQADAAMYKAKQSGKNRFVFCQSIDEEITS